MDFPARRRSLKWLALPLVISTSLCGCGGFALGVAASIEAQYEAACRTLGDSGTGVSETTAESRRPVDKVVQGYEPAYWTSNPETVADPGTKSGSAAQLGRLLVAAQSVSFVPSSGGRGIHIPYRAIHDVEVRVWSATKEPRAMRIRTCGGRIDEFSFPPKEGSGKLLDPELPTKAAKQITELGLPFAWAPPGRGN